MNNVIDKINSEKEFNKKMDKIWKNSKTPGCAFAKSIRLIKQNYQGKQNYGVQE